MYFTANAEVWMALYVCSHWFSSELCCSTWWIWFAFFWRCVPGEGDRPGSETGGRCQDEDEAETEAHGGQDSFSASKCLSLMLSVSVCACVCVCLCVSCMQHVRLCIR